MRESIRYDIMFKISYGKVENKSKHLIISESSFINACVTFLAQRYHMGNWKLASNKIKITFSNTVINTTIEDIQILVSNVIL